MASQTTLAIPPAPITRITALNTGPFINGATISIPQGQSSVAVQFTYEGADENDRILFFECRWGGGSLPASTFDRRTCDANVSTEQRRPLEVGGPLYWVKIGSVSRNFPVSLTPYTFEVRVVNDDMERSIPSIWRFPVLGYYTFFQSASMTFLRVSDSFDNVITSSRPTTSRSIAINWHGSGLNLYRHCWTSPSQGTMPPQISYDSNPNLFNNCYPIEPPQGQFGAHSSDRVGDIGRFWKCGVVIGVGNVPSDPACISWEVVTASSVSPPITAISSHWAVGVSGSNEIPRYPPGSTPYHNAYFNFWANPPTGSSDGTGRRALFDCRWDGSSWTPCGVPMPIFLCLGPPGAIRCSSSLTFPGLAGVAGVNDVSNGRHNLEVRARYTDGEPGPSTTFVWCVIPRGTCDLNSQPSDYIRIIPSDMSQESMLPGINESFIIPDAGFNKIIVENDTAKLSATLFAVNSGLLLNKTTTVKIPILWKQIQGPAVDLNSTDTQAVEFLAPSVGNDTLLKFNFTVTDPKGINSTDTTSIFLVTKEDEQKYNGNFCDAMVAKALEQINSTNMTADSKGEDNNTLDNKTRSSMELAKKYLSECEGPLDQYAKQLGNLTEIFTNLHVISPAANVTGSAYQLQTPALGQAPQVASIKNSSAE